ncbi:MAG: hypothetical protein MR466_03895 [Ruminococcus sp.]|jgi:hypothetical protein|nr:hypothetical protein [Ruminococcus sp.]
MHYFTVHLLKAIQTGTDILGNPITTLQEPCAACTRYTGRFTEWTAEDVKLVGRDVTQTQRKLLTDAPLARCKEADVVRAGSEDYRITSVKDLHGRWRMLYLERWYQTLQERRCTT